MLVGTGLIRNWLGLKPADKALNPKLEQLSKATQKFVEGQTFRKFDAKLYKTDSSDSFYDGTGETFIYVRQYPVWYVNEVSVDNEHNFDSAANLISTADIYIDPDKGKIMSEQGFFSRGRRNVMIEYFAGYGTQTNPVDGFRNSSGTPFAIPEDLQQLIIEMSAQAHKEGISGIHSVAVDQEVRFIQMLGKNSLWRKTIQSYKNVGALAEHGFDSS